MSLLFESIDESNSLNHIEIQQELLNQIKKSNGYDVVKTQELIQSISNLVYNDYEFSWYFENNQLINLFVLDCFETIIYSYFILEQKDSKNGIKLLTTLMSRTNLKETKYKSYSFKHDWLTLNYRSFFINTLPMLQYTFDKYNLNQETELIESIFILIYYIIVSLPFNQLIKNDFINESAKFLIKYANKSPITPLKIVTVLLNDQHVIFCSMRKVEQYYFLRNISKCLIGLLDFKRIVDSCHKNGLMKKIDIADSLDGYHRNLFKLIATFSNLILNYISIHKEPKSVLLLNDLLDPINYILSRLPIINLLELIHHDEFIPNIVKFLKAITCYDLSFFLVESKTNHQRKLFVSIIRIITSALKRTGSIPINGTKKFDSETIQNNVELVISLAEKLETVLKETDHATPANIFRHSVEHVLNLYESLLWFIQIKIDNKLLAQQNEVVKAFDLLYNSVESFADLVSKIFI